GERCAVAGRLDEVRLALTVLPHEGVHAGDELDADGLVRAEADEGQVRDVHRCEVRGRGTGTRGSRPAVRREARAAPRPGTPGRPPSPRARRTADAARRRP